MEKDEAIRVRPATQDDEDFIVSLIPRLTLFGPPAWRNEKDMEELDVRVVRDTIIHQPEGTAIFIAEDVHQTRLGFIHLFLGNDYYYKEKHGHISDLIVTSGAEGKGIGRKLIQVGEDWARENGFHWLSLSVFAQNVRARELYQRAGYSEDLVKYIKVL